jgi:hypothetical protein
MDWEIKKIKTNGWRRNFGFKIIGGEYESNRMRNKFGYRTMRIYFFWVWDVKHIVGIYREVIRIFLNFFLTVFSIKMCV